MVNANPRRSLSLEEQMGLLEEPTISDVESEATTATDVENRFSLTKLPTPLPNLIVFRPWNYLRSVPWRVLIVRSAIFLTPSFLQGRHAREQLCPSKLYPTAYLDGMRGLAALSVFICHYSYQAFVIAQGWGCGEANYNLLKLPFLRLFYQGPPAVCVFFIISGYALSYKPLKLLRGQQVVEFSNNMSSLVFRRGIRLYLPTVISTLMIIGLLRIGVYEWTREFANDRTYMRNIVEPHPLRAESTYVQFTEWLSNMFHFAHVFGWERAGGSTVYDPHLWTIPVEFRCSLYLFLVLVGTARLRTAMRLVVVCGVIWYSYWHSRWELLLFYCGMLLAEWDHIRGAHTAAAPAMALDEKESPVSQSSLGRWLWVMSILLGLYLMCQPEEQAEVTPGWRYLSSLIPTWWTEEKYRYWQSVGSIIFVFSVGHARGWQQFFNTPVVQYFGKISFALYLMHGPAMHCVGYHWEMWAYRVTGVEGYWYNAGFVLGSLFCIPTVIWWADVFWRAVDIPSVKVAKWLEQKCTVKE